LLSRKIFSARGIVNLTDAPQARKNRPTSSDLPYESLTTISDLIRRKRLSSVEVTDATLQRIAKLDGQYHSYATVHAERSLDQAKAADAEISRDLWRGPLHGVPIAVKDLCYTTFAATLAGSTIFKNFVGDRSKVPF
jgi:amidase